MRLVLALLVLASVGAASAGVRADSPSSAVVWIADRPSLGTVLRRIDQRYPGRALAARTVERKGRTLYLIKWLGTDGRVRDITCDARTGEILRVR